MSEKSLITVLLLITGLVFSCNKNSDTGSKLYKARVAGYDLNCSVCLLQFPDDNPALIERIGESDGNIYKAINLNKADFEIGQEFKVALRSPSTDEIKACITLYPSLNYKEVVVEDKVDFRYISYNDTLTLDRNECIYDPAEKFYICFDSVTNESRCPLGVECFWAGMAKMKFRVQNLDSGAEFYNLRDSNDTLTFSNGIRMRTISLEPWPKSGSTIKQNDYRVNLVFSKSN
jgi:hypothetical protein